MRRMSGTVTFFCSMRKRPPRTDGPGGRQVRCPGEAGGNSSSPIPVPGALEAPVGLAEPPPQHLRPGLEIDDEVRPREPLIEHLEDLLVELELVRPERDRGEDAVFGEEVVGDDALREELQLAELALPAIALEEEEELGLEGMSLRVLVKSPEEGILLHLLEEEL